MHRNRTWLVDSTETVLRTQRNRILPIEGGDGSTLTLDFTTGQLDPRLTFTRASTATYINSQGYVATMAAAPTNDPTKARFDYDPTTLAPRGLLIEGTATNLFNWSETFDTTGGATNWNWSVNVTRGTVTTTNPTGASATVIKIEETTTNGLHAPLTVPTVLASTTYTFSVWAKAVERTFVQLWENGGSGANSMVNLSTGAVVSESTAGITTVTALGTTGWYRISMRLTTIVGQVTANCQLRLSTNGTTTSYAGTTGSGIYIWGAQLEQGSGASSYIPTGASQVTRLADFCSITSPNFAPWYGSPTGWTIVAEMTPQSRAAGSFPGMLALRSAADSGLRIYYYNDGTYNTAFRFGTASTGTEVYGPNGVTYGVPRKFGASVTSGTQFASSAGVQIGSTQTLAVPMDQTLLAIGSDGVAPTPAVNCRMNFRSIKYWPYAMTLADLNARTT